MTHAAFNGSFAQLAAIYAVRSIRKFGLKATVCCILYRGPLKADNDNTMPQCRCSCAADYDYAASYRSPIVINGIPDVRGLVVRCLRVQVLLAPRSSATRKSTVILIFCRRNLGG
jgi:hypothetical protein